MVSPPLIVFLGERRKIAMEQKRNNLAVLFIVVAGIMWGCIGLFVRPLKENGLNSMDIVALRAYVTLISMLVFLIIYDKRLLIIRLKDIWIFFGTGVCSILFFNYCYFTCINLTSLSVAAILLYTAPAFVMIFSYFLFREKFTGKKLISLIMTFAGCALVTGIMENNNISINGIIVGLGAGVGYALYSIFGKFALERGYNSMTITIYTFLAATIGTLFIADNTLIYNTVTKDMGIAMLSVAFGIISTVLPYLFYTMGLRYVENGKASIIASIEPVTATILGFLIYQENISVGGIIGICMVITALIICNK